MPGHIRLAYCRGYDYIEEGMKRIKEAVEVYNTVRFKLLRIITGAT